MNLLSLARLLHPTAAQVKKEQGKVSQPTLLKRGSLLEGLISLISTEPDDLRRSCVRGHMAVYKAGAAFAKAAADLEGQGKETEQRVMKDKSRVLIKGVMKAAQNFEAAVAALGNTREQAEGAAETAALLPSSTDAEGAEMAEGAEPAASTDAEEDSRQTARLCTLELASVEAEVPFLPLLESEMILDCMARHLTALREALHKSCQALRPTIASVSGDSSWKDTLTAESSLEDVLTQGVKTLLKMKARGVALQGLLAALVKDQCDRLFFNSAF